MCWLGKMINRVISECNKLVQKEYTTGWERWSIGNSTKKKKKFHHIFEWYLHKPESILENEMRKILRDFEIQTDHQISAKRPDLLIINKKNRTAVRAKHRIKIKEN